MHPYPNSSRHSEPCNPDPHVRVGQRVGKGAPIGNTYPLLQHPSGQKEFLWLVMSGPDLLSVLLGLWSPMSSPSSLGLEERQPLLKDF